MRDGKSVNVEYECMKIEWNAILFIFFGIFPPTFTSQLSSRLYRTKLPRFVNKWRAQGRGWYSRSKSSFLCWFSRDCYPIQAVKNGISGSPRKGKRMRGGGGGGGGVLRTKRTHTYNKKVKIARTKINKTKRINTIRIKNPPAKNVNTNFFTCNLFSGYLWIVANWVEKGEKGNLFLLSSFFCTRIRTGLFQFWDTRYLHGIILDRWIG